LGEKNITEEQEYREEKRMLDKARGKMPVKKGEGKKARMKKKKK